MRLWLVAKMAPYEGTILGDVRAFSSEEKARAYIAAHPIDPRSYDYDMGIVELDGEPVKYADYGLLEGETDDDSGRATP